MSYLAIRRHPSTLLGKRKESLSHPSGIRPSKMSATSFCLQVFRIPLHSATSLFHDGWLFIIFRDGIALREKTQSGRAEERKTEGKRRKKLVRVHVIIARRLSSVARRPLPVLGLRGLARPLSPLDDTVHFNRPLDWAGIRVCPAAVVDDKYNKDRLTLIYPLFNSRTGFL